MLLRKPVFEYYLMATLKAMRWFLLIWAGIFVLTTTGLSAIQVGTATVNGANFSGGEGAFLFFFFIAMMSDFTAEMHFLFQHGVSRRAAFGGMVSLIFVSGAIWAATLMVTNVLFGAIGSLVDVNAYGDMFPTLYSGWLETVGAVPEILMTFAFYWGALIMAGILGYFISILFNKLSKTGKMILGGAAIALAIALPMVNTIAGGRLVQFALWFGRVFVGPGAVANPWRGICVFLVIAAIFLVPSWLMIRRMKLKK